MPPSQTRLTRRFDVALEHAAALVAQKGEKAGIPESRKHMAWYLHGVRGAAAARFEIMQAETTDQLRMIFEKLEQNILLESL